VRSRESSRAVHFPVEARRLYSGEDWRNWVSSMVIGVIGMAVLVSRTRLAGAGGEPNVVAADGGGEMMPAAAATWFLVVATDAVASRCAAIVKDDNDPMLLSVVAVVGVSSSSVTCLGRSNGVLIGLNLLFVKFCS